MVKYLELSTDLVLIFQSSSQQEAHKMVHEANVKQAAAEKQLKEAQGKVCEAVLWVSS